MFQVTYYMFQVTRTCWTLPVTCWKLNLYKCGLLSVAAVECWTKNVACGLLNVECCLCMIHVACYMIHVACCMMHVAWCMLHDACCMMHDAWRMLHDTSCMMHVAHWMLYNYKIVYAARCMIVSTHENKLYAYIISYHDSYIPCKLRSLQYFSENLYISSIYSFNFRAVSSFEVFAKNNS